MRSRSHRVAYAARAAALLLLTTCTDNAGPTFSSSPTPPPPPPYTADVTSGPALLVGAGDIARCDRTNDEATGLLLDNYPSATVFTAGDNTNGNASLTDFNNCYGPSWGRNKARTRPAVGNNDYKQTNAAGFNQYFGAAGGALGNYYYSYDLGAWHIMVLNDQIAMTVGSPQELWLRNELALNTKKCTLAYWHRPRFSSTGTNNLAAVRPLWDALYAYNADVVVNAHLGVYERFAPQSPTAVAAPLGIREFIVGTGGVNLQTPGAARPNSQVRDGTTYGVLLFTLDTASYAWQFVPIAGSTFTDAGSTACHTRIAVASVVVSPGAAAILPNGTVQLTATPQDAAGNPLTGRTVTWATSNAAIATVDTNGLVTGKAAGGPVTITATSEGKSGTSAITVNPAPVATVDVTPSPASVAVGATVQLTATPKDANGNTLTGRIVTWWTSDASLATVDSTGLVTGKGVGGPVTITAISEGKSGTSAVTVTPPPVATVDVTPSPASVVVGTTVQLTATPKDGNGNPLTGRTVTWATSDANLATVDANGLVTGNAAGGPVTITATSEGKSGSSAVTVNAVPVATVDVSPASGTIQVGATIQLTATPKDANGNPLTGRAVTWSTSNAALATVDANGLVTGAAAGGPVTLTATIEGKTGTAAITVIPVPVASVGVTPATATIGVNATLQLTATPKDANGNPLTGRSVAWATSDASIATVDGTGLVTGKVEGGPVTITATSEGKNGTSAITVSATVIPVASVSVTPPAPSIPVGGNVQLTATPKDASGNPLSGRTITWQSGALGIATVDGSGLVHGVAAGSATVTATSEGKSGSATVSVTPPPVASVTVTPSSPTIPANGTVQLTATPKDANGNPLSGRTVTWTTSAPSIAAVNGSGFVVGLATGNATITATSEGIVGTSAITVQPGSGPAVLVGAGDIADCSRVSQEGTARLLDGIAGTVATFGDGAYPDGSLTDYMNCFDPSWGRHKARTRPSTGNHEYNHGQAAGAPGYYAYWGAAAGDSGIGYYSYNLGAWHIVVINSSLDMSAGSTQEQWLRADLAAHPATCTLAYWHHPRFSSGGNGSTVATQPIWQALYDFGADVVANGHDHDYERFAPQTPTGALDNVNGIREFVVGTGGNSLYSFDIPPIANSETRSNVNYGVIKFTLWPTSYDWDFIPVAGGTFSDHGTASCHSGTPLPNQAPVANPGGPYNSEGTVVLDGTQSRDPDNNTPITYAWDLGDGTTATTATVTHTYPADGSYVVTLTVRDATGLSSTPASTSVTVRNVPPSVNTGPDQSVVGGTALNLRATFSDPGTTDNPWSYTITWGDGATDAGSTNTQANPITASHLYPAPGRYTARVTVTDKDGGVGSDDIVVKVLDPATVQIFSGASNIASCGTDEDEATAQILDTLPGTVFVLGDNVNPSGSAANYTNCYTPTWGRHKARTRAVVGNHEYDVAGANAFYTYFKPNVGDSAKYYYSFNLGPYWHVIVLNNTASVANGAGSVEEQWLKADLAANTKPCTIAMFHYPLYFSSDDPTWHSASGVLPFWIDLYNANAEIVLNGQQYDYERFAAQDAGANLDPARGLVSFNPGTGGYASSMPTSIAPNTQAVSDAYGVLKLTLGPDSYIWDFIPAPGYTFTDHGSGNCH